MAATTSHRGEIERSAERHVDALVLLRADHEQVDALFKGYEKNKGKWDSARKRMAAMEICKSLSIHAQIEEEIFYPACDAQVEDAADLLAEARVEHQSLRDLISKIEDGRAGDDRFDAEVKVLGEFTRHHVREEQNELFPKVQKSDLDRAEIGRLLARRKAELMAEADPDRTAMSKGTAEAQKHQKSQKKLDHELKESFPASDPPAATIPTIADRGPRK